MKSAAEIQAERLRVALTESCCGSCGAVPKPGKKGCRCDDSPAKDKVADTSVGPEFEGGQDIPVRVNEEKKRPTTHPFIKRCVAAITKDDENVERSELSRAFAICTAQKQKSPAAAKAKKKEGVPAERMADYERALAQAREKSEEGDVSLFNRVNSRALIEKEGRPTKPEARLDGQPGYWRRLANHNIFFTMDGTPMMPVIMKKPKPKASPDAVPAKKPDEKSAGKTAAKPAAKPEEKKEKKEDTPEQKKLKEVGKALADKKQGEMNVGKEKLADTIKYVEDKFAEAGTTPEAVIGPKWKENLAALKEKMKEADDIPRIHMPVIEPPTKEEKARGEGGDIEKVKDALTTGAMDIKEPYAKETKRFIKKYGTPLPWEHGKMPIKPGSPQAKKLMSLGLPTNDKGDPDDDATNAVTGHIGVKSLKPLQNQIWMNKVVGNLMQFGVPKQGGHLTDEAPIIVSKDDYILDGHHRYGQAMLADPSLKLKTIHMKELDKEQMLAATRAATAALGKHTKP